jgi:hypothetical protein
MFQRAESVLTFITLCWWAPLGLCGGTYLRVSVDDAFIEELEGVEGSRSEVDFARDALARMLGALEENVLYIHICVAV